MLGRATTGTSVGTTFAASMSNVGTVELETKRLRSDGHSNLRGIPHLLELLDMRWLTVTRFAVETGGPTY